MAADSVSAKPKSSVALILLDASGWRAIASSAFPVAIPIAIAAVAQESKHSATPILSIFHYHSFLVLGGCIYASQKWKDTYLYGLKVYLSNLPP